MSAFLDNTPVEGRQVASTFHIFCQDLLLLLSRTKEKLSGGTWSKKIKSTKKQKKKNALATSGGALLGRTHQRESPRWAARQLHVYFPPLKKVSSWTSSSFFLCHSIVDPGEVCGRWIFQKRFIAATSVRQKQSGSIYIGKKGRKSAQLISHAEHPTPELPSRPNAQYLAWFMIFIMVNA